MSSIDSLEARFIAGESGSFGFIRGGMELSCTSISWAGMKSVSWSPHVHFHSCGADLEGEFTMNFPSGPFLMINTEKDR